MKTVFPTRQVIHLWANGRTDEARNSQGNVKSEGGRLWSYRECIAARFGDVAVFTDATHSVTTSRHQSLSRYAWPGPIRYRLPHLPHATPLSLAVYGLDKAADKYHDAVQMRRSGKRDGILATAATYVDTSAMLARLASEDADAAVRKRARVILKTINALPAVPEAVDAESGKAQAIAAAERVSMLALPRVKRDIESLRQRAESYLREAQRHREEGGALYEFGALNYAHDAATRAQNDLTRYKLPLRGIGKTIRMIAARVAELRPAVEAAKAKRAHDEARLWMARGARDERAGEPSSYWITRVDELTCFGAEFLTPSESAWYAARTAKQQRRDSIDRAHSATAGFDHHWRAAQSYMPDYPADALRHATYARTAVDAAATLPATHPARKLIPKGVREAVAEFIGHAQRIVDGRRAQREAEAIARAAKWIERWRAGENVGYLDGVPTMVRLRGTDEIETSRGAIVPRSVAPMLHSMIAGVRAAGAAREFESRHVMVGAFRLNRIDADGTVHIGCHTIRGAEVDRGFALLGMGAP